jgi:hypothetical protein
VKQDVVSVAVSGAQDAAGNVQVDYASAPTVPPFGIDTQNPTALDNGMTAAPLLVVDATAGPEKFTLAVTFSEAMLTSATPTFAFPTPGEDPTAGGTLTFARGAWSAGNTTYTAYYTVVDRQPLGLDMQDVDVRVLDARDAAGNLLVARTYANVFDVDMRNPTVTVTAMPATAGENSGTLALMLTFSEPMNQSLLPRIGFPTAGEDPVPDGSLTYRQGIWTSSMVYTATFDVADRNVELRNIDVSVSGTRDVAGNPQQPDPTLVPNVFSIDTKAPTVVGPLVLGDTLISDADVGVGRFWVKVTFDGAMNTASYPTIEFTSATPTPTFAADVANTLRLVTPAPSDWSADGKTYTAHFTVLDGGQGTAQLLRGVDVPNVAVKVTNATDSAGNRQSVAYTGAAAEQFRIDTLNPLPTVTLAGSSAATIVGNPLPNPIRFTVTFPEDVTGFGDPGEVSFAGSTDPTAWTWTLGTSTARTYEVLVSPQPGAVSKDSVLAVSVPKLAARDAALNDSPASSTLAVALKVPPQPAVTVPATQPPFTNTMPVDFIVTFDEPVTGFGDSPSDVSFAGSTAPGNLVPVVTQLDADGKVYDVAVVGMEGSGAVVVSVPANVCVDKDGPNPNLASSSASVFYDVDQPWAEMFDPANGASIDVNELNDRRYLDVSFLTNWGVGLSEGTIIDPGAEFTLSGPGVGSVTIVDVPTKLDKIDRYRYSFTGDFAAGPVTVNFLAGSFSDNAGNLNKASQSSFNVTGASGSISIANAKLVEGNSGKANMVFTVTLSAASTSTVTVGYDTMNGTALAGADYTAKRNRTLTFAPGKTKLTITVPVIGDTAPEANETFKVVLKNAVNASIARTAATGTITNDDPGLSINSVSARENGVATFTVTLSPKSNSQVTVVYNTADSTATAAGKDYVAKRNKTLTFAPGQTTKTITVSVLADSVADAGEKFKVTLSNPSGAGIVKSTGVATITTDVAAAKARAAVKAKAVAAAAPVAATKSVKTKAATAVDNASLALLLDLASATGRSSKPAGPQQAAVDEAIRRLWS